MLTASESATRAAVQSAGGVQPSSASQPPLPSANQANPPLILPLPSATQTNPPLSFPAVRPLLVDVAAVVVTAAGWGPSLDWIQRPQCPGILSHLRVVVGLKAKSVRPNDDQFGDIVALEHIALLGEGHCLTLIQKLVTG